MARIELIIFDCDGVMFDTKKANTSYYNQILRYMDKPLLTPEQFAFAHMHTADETLACLLSDERDLEKAQAYRKTMSYVPFIQDMIVEPYLKPLLKKLRPERKTAVATNRSDTMNHVLAEHSLERCFDMVVTSLDVKYPKPHPESLFMILNHFALDPDQSIYIGDSKLDELAARDAGVPFVAYDNLDLDASYHITSLREIEPLLKVS
jgi:phosphoglycolate phosphatase